ncbi:MAG: hypothetical protein MJY42_04725 [Bacteroidales bacterium]|nr:hypothetical protein [Bacteroidales bacterium]
MKKSTKIIVEIALLLVSIGLVYLIYNSIMQPVRFNKQKEYRESVAVQRLKDIRTLQVAFKSTYGRFAPSVDTLKDFYENGKMEILMQVGSSDDSLAVAFTEGLKKKGATPAQLLEMYNAGQQNLVFSVRTTIPTKDSLFVSRTDFNIDSLYTIPFSGGQPLQMQAVSKMVSGVSVPLFEADAPYDLLLKGLDRQLIINLKADCRDKNKFEGLQVGSIDSPNNNAGNWE